MPNKNCICITITYRWPLAVCAFRASLGSTENAGTLGTYSMRKDNMYLSKRDCL